MTPSAEPIAVPKWLMDKRCTGRTTRMLHAVKDACDSGPAYIFVVMPTNAVLSPTQKAFERMLPILDGVPLFTHANRKTYFRGSEVNWMSCEERNWRWDLMQFENVHPSCIYFVDPSCIERRFRHLLDAWHRFDSPWYREPSTGIRGAVFERELNNVFPGAPE